MKEQRNAGTTAMADAPARPFDDLAADYGLPLSTLQKLRSRGEGPKCFKLGRRLYVTREAERAWIAERAQQAAA